MNKIQLNTITDGGVIIKKGGGGGGVTINNQEKSVDITENGTTEVVADAGFTGLSKVVVNTNVASSGGGSGWTGHADAEGLRAIGWTDEDIAYYQEHGVNWNAEDDEYHKVTDDNKALYGVLTADNISSYKDRIVYLPKIDTSSKTSMSSMFNNCFSLTAIPQLDTQNVTSMSSMFNNCYSLVSIPQLDTQNVTNMKNMFNNCYSLTAIPQLDTQNVTSMNGMFNNCFSLTAIPQLDTQNVTSMENMFYNCFSLTAIPQLDTSKVVYSYYMFFKNIKLYSIEYDGSSMTNVDHFLNDCYNLLDLRVRGIKRAVAIPDSYRIRKESLLYLINNEAATSAITIKLASSAYTRLATDADIVAALANHPNISLAK